LNSENRVWHHEVRKTSTSDETSMAMAKERNALNLKLPCFNTLSLCKKTKERKEERTKEK